VLADYRTALVTGASRGMGEAFARQLAARRLNLVLVARSQDRLEALADELSAAHGVAAHVVVADLAEPHAAEAVFAATERLGLEVDLLVNNAGFSKAGPFAELPLDVQAEMVRLNVNTVVGLTRLYLPGMRQRKRGGVINVSSTAGFQPVPHMAVYGATKAFVLSFSEAVAAEVAGDGVRVMALCPGATGTEFWSTAGLWQERMAQMSTPDEVVAAGLRAFARGRWSFVPGFVNQVAALFSGRVLPGWLVARLAQRWF
jgi:short-subunit dehydrogenase